LGTSEKRRHDDYDLVKKTRLGLRLECVELKGSERAQAKEDVTHLYQRLSKRACEVGCNRDEAGFS
jgi:hypothetical protein